MRTADQAWQEMRDQILGFADALRTMQDPVSPPPATVNRVRFTESGGPPRNKLTDRVRAVIGAVCPDCGSVEVDVVNSPSAGGWAPYFSCRDCDTTWRRPGNISLD
jgi:hypothetical protein